jgi:hypothetical protein
MNACVLGVAWTSLGALRDPNLLAVHRQDRVVEVLAGDLVRQVVVAGPVSGTQAYIA